LSNEVEYDEMLSVLVEAFRAFNKSADKLSKTYNHFMESIESGVEKNYKRQFDNGEEFSVFIKPIEGVNGRIIGALEVLSHSEQTYSYNQKQESDYITRLVKTMSDVVMNIVYQMRSPLGAIQLFAEILKEDLDNDRAYMVDEILASVYYLDAVLSNLLSSVQPLAPSIQKVDFIDIIEESLAFSAPAIRQQNIKLTKDFTNEHLYCYGDIEQLKQVCFNLILNAIQAMSEGGNLMIRTSYSDDMKNIYIEIEDSGCGIPNELMDRIFTPFFTTKEGGTGLGLYVVYRIIQAHKGKIDIKSIAEMGTKINIKLPS
jgi:two-component system sporulation sensor kinase A